MTVAKRYMVNDREQSPLGEAFWALKNCILEVQEDGACKTILVTGIGDGEGAAIVAANMAAFLARSGRSVVLVDADLRQPVIHKIFGFGLQAGELVAAIHGEKELTAVLRPSGIYNLKLLTNGEKYQGNPVSLLSDEMTKKIIRQLRETADFVVINSSPLTFSAHKVISDACILASKVDGVVMVLDAHGIRTTVAQKAVELLKGARANIIGAVLNDVKNEQDFIYHVEELKQENCGQ
ncbi:CpsD/CapB family tyrosine-protein kinase [Azotosporobacter soli]|uniref:tyrosine-protein kinase family protein n=1 Tax=Azotosporobacter soli TaxID=3055040 RepID=UPI0031FF3B2D